MPESYIQKPQARISNLAIGETGYISFEYILVDEKDLAVYIFPEAKLVHDGILAAIIRRDADGYHLVLRRNYSFRPREIPDHTNLLPVVEVTEDTEPTSMEKIEADQARVQEIVNNISAGKK